MSAAEQIQCRLCVTTLYGVKDAERGVCAVHAYELSDHTSDAFGVLFFSVYELESERTYVVRIDPNKPAKVSIVHWLESGSDVERSADELSVAESMPVERWVKRSRAVFSVVEDAIIEAQYARVED